MLNIPRSKGNQTIKSGQLLEYNKGVRFFKNNTENETGRLVTDLFLFFKKAVFEVKANGPQLSIQQKQNFRLLVGRYAQF